MMTAPSSFFFSSPPADDAAVVASSFALAEAAAATSRSLVAWLYVDCRVRTATLRSLQLLVAFCAAVLHLSE